MSRYIAADKLTCTQHSNGALALILSVICKSIVKRCRTTWGVNVLHAFVCTGVLDFHWKCGRAGCFASLNLSSSRCTRSRDRVWLGSCAHGNRNPQCIRCANQTHVHSHMHTAWNWVRWACVCNSFDIKHHASTRAPRIRSALYENTYNTQTQQIYTTTR